MTGAEDVDPATIERPAIPAGRPGSAHEIAAASTSDESTGTWGTWDTR